MKKKISIATVIKPLISNIFSLKSLCIIITFVFIFFVLPQSIKEILISNNGKIINAEIIKMPKVCGGKNTYVDFKYLNRKFYKRVGSDFCKDNKQGKIVEFYYSEKYPNDFIFKVEKGAYLKTQLFSAILVTLLLGGTTYYLFMKK